jgi:hypothetical protein
MAAMFRYRNTNNGDVVEYEHPDARLEMLPNWERLGAEAAPETGGPADEQDGRPAKSAPKSAWLAYARGRVKDADENDELDMLTKDELVERYGA